MSLQQNLQHETVDRLNLRSVIMLAPDRTVREAVVAMREEGLGCVVLVDEQDKPVGLFTEAMLRGAICRTPGCIDEPLSEHAASQVPWVSKDDPIEMVIDAMETKNHRFVVVVDEVGKVVGLTGQKSVMEFVAEHFPGEVMVQRVGSEAFPKTREGA